MMTRAAVLATLPLLASVTAHADDTVQTQTAGTVVVVTPSAPIVAVTGASQVAPAPVAAGPSMVAPVAPTAPAATPAPQNEDWRNVSHINGQLVKVGERQDYLIKFKETNISANPFGPMFGYWDVGFARAMSQNIALSGSLAYYSHDSSYSSNSMTQVTVSLPIYFRRTFSGPFLEPGLIYRGGSSSYMDSYSSTSGSTTNTNSYSWTGPEVLFGWHWNFDSGLNVSWAFGMAKHMSDSTDGNHDEPDVNGYFRVGYNF